MGISNLMLIKSNSRKKKPTKKFLPFKQTPNHLDFSKILKVLKAKMESKTKQLTLIFKKKKLKMIQ